MNLKVAHLVSIQFGLFVGIVSCLVFSRLENARLRAVVEMREPATERAAAVAPKSESEDERVEDYRGELEPAEPLTEQPTPAMPNEYSPEAVEKSMAILTKLYYEQIAPRRNVSSSAASTPVAPAYTEVAQEPESVHIEDPMPEPVAYVQPTQVVVYPPPAQFVVFSHPRRLVNRCRPPAGHRSADASNSHRRGDNRTTHVSGFPGSHPRRSPGLAPRLTTGGPTCSSNQGFLARGKR